MQKGTAEIFFRKVMFWKEDGEGDAPPVFVGILLKISHRQCTFIFLLHMGRTIIAVSDIYDFACLK